MKKNTIIKYSSCALFTIAVGVIYFFTKDVASKETFKEVVGCLSDILLISGLFLVGAALLTLISAKGGFDAISFGFKSLGTLFTPSKGKLREKVTYYDYIKSKEEKNRKMKFFLMYAGLFDLGLAIITFIIYLMI